MIVKHTFIFITLSALTSAGCRPPSSTRHAPIYLILVLTKRSRLARKHTSLTKCLPPKHTDPPNVRQAQNSRTPSAGPMLEHQQGWGSKAPFLPPAILVVAGKTLEPTSTSIPRPTAGLPPLMQHPSAKAGVCDGSIGARCMSDRDRGYGGCLPETPQPTIGVWRSPYTRAFDTKRLLCQCAQHQHEERLVWRARQRHVSHGRVGWVWVGRADGAGAPCRR